MEKAKRGTIELGDHELDVFLLPDGSYWFSQTQIAQAVGLEEIYARRFLRSKWLKTLPGKGFMPDNIAKIEVESTTQTWGQTRISPIDLTTAALQLGRDPLRQGLRSVVCRFIEKRRSPFSCEVWLV